MKTKTLLGALAVSSLVLAQPAAAATRSYESLPKAGASTPAERVASVTGQSEAAVGALPIWLIILVFGSFAAFIAAISDNKSPG